MDAVPAGRGSQPAVSVRERLPRDLAWIGAAVALLTTWRWVGEYGWGIDSGAYWSAWRDGLYDVPPTGAGAYLYSPAFAQLLWPLVQVPRTVFVGAFSVVTTVALWWLLRPAGRAWWPPLLLCCSFEIATGNINWLLAVVVALGLRRPAWWAVPALTKVTPCLGPVWFLVRREWRSLAESLGAVAVVVVVSAAVAPHLWLDWIDFLRDNADRGTSVLGGSLLPPPVVRVPAAVLLVAWGALRDRRWVLPVGVILASPVFGIGALAVLTGLVRLSRDPGPELLDSRS